MYKTLNKFKNRRVLKKPMKFTLKFPNLQKEKHKSYSKRKHRKIANIDINKQLYRNYHSSDTLIRNHILF